MKKFAISFKGGLARGFGAIGVMRFLEEEDLHPDIVAGSSSGAMVAASIALGYKWERILEMVTSFRFRDIISLTSLINDGSLVSYDKYREKLLAFNHDTKIEDLPIRLIVFVTDPSINERVYLEKGSLVNALMASSGFPLIFPGVKVNGKEVLDGDLTGGFSARRLHEEGARVVIGVGHKLLPFTRHKKMNAIAKVTEAYQIMNNQINILNDEVEPVDLAVRYDVGEYSYTNFRDLEKITDIAYEEIKKKKSDILDLLR